MPAASPSMLADLIARDAVTAHWGATENAKRMAQSFVELTEQLADGDDQPNWPAIVAQHELSDEARDDTDRTFNHPTLLATEGKDAISAASALLHDDALDPAAFHERAQDLATSLIVMFNLLGAGRSVDWDDLAHRYANAA